MKYLQPPTEEQRERARKEVNCTEDSVKRDVQHLIEWLEKQPHLPNLKDDDILANYLLNCKNSLENTKIRLENFFRFKAVISEIFCNQNPFDKRIEIGAKFISWIPLRKLTPDGYRVIVIYLPSIVQTSEIISNHESIFKMNQMMLDTLSKYDYSRGMIFVTDVRFTNMELVTFAASQVHRLALYIQNVKLVRYKKFYVFNMNRGAEILISIIKPFAKKILNKIEILKNPSDVSNLLPKEIVPRDFGGDELSLEELKDMWYEELKNQHEFLKMTGNWVADLSKVSIDIKNSEFFGLNGSFRQIAVD